MKWTKFNTPSGEFYETDFCGNIIFIRAKVWHSVGKYVLDDGWYYTYYGIVGFHGPFATPEEAMKECENEVLKELKRLLYEMDS